MAKDAEYFRLVEEQRYRDQYWVHDYFQFQDHHGKDVLEIGVGQGTDLIQFARGGAHCYGVDITENHLNICAQNFHVQNHKISLCKTNAAALPFSDSSFDLACSFGVIHHILEIDSVLDEIQEFSSQAEYSCFPSITNGRHFTCCGRLWQMICKTDKFL